MMMSAYSGSGWRGPLVRYVVAATLVRGADGGAAVGIVLLALAPDPHGAGGAGPLARARRARPSWRGPDGAPTAPALARAGARRGARRARRPGRRVHGVRSGARG